MHMLQFSCEKTLLQSAVNTASRTVAAKSSIPALEGLLIHADQQLTISGYNMQTGIRTNVFANVVEGGDIVLNARLFGDIIRRMPDDMITFTADEKMMVHVSCGDADFDILGLSAADYPDLPEVEDEYAVSMQQKVLRSMIEEVAFAVSTNESRPVHTGALFEIADMSLSMVAVDGFRLAFRREKLEKLDGVESVSGLGLMIGIALKDKKAIDVANAALEKGLLVLTAKTKVRLLPPLTITDEEIEKGVAILADVLSK